jgi:hypothetical protein
MEAPSRQSADHTRHTPARWATDDGDVILHRERRHPRRRQRRAEAPAAAAALPSALG